MALAKKVINQTVAIREFEKPEVCKSIKVANANRWTVGLSPAEWDEREARLKKEREKNTKTPVPGEEQPEESNPALKEAASQFNDALLDEQAKKIKRLGKEIARLNGIIHDKNAVLSDVADELRLSKIREKNLTEVCQKYMKENEELKKEVADKVVEKIDAQALKSSESALAYKEKVIADLGNELAATKEELEAFKESYKRRLKDDSEHFELIQRICDVSLEKWLIESEYLEKDKPFRFPNYDIASGKENKKPSLFKDDKSHGEVTNQKDISPSLKATVRLFDKEIEDLFKEIKRLWQE